MKKGLLYLVMLVLLPVIVWAGIVTITWDTPTANTDGTPLTDLAGFKIYYGNSSGFYTNSITVPSPTTTSYVMSISTGTWYFAMTAYNTSGQESDFSNEVMRFVPPSVPNHPTLIDVTVQGLELV